MPNIGFTEFQFPTLVDDPPEGDDWIHEVKYDGYRTQIVLRNGLAQAYTRNGHDWSTKYPTICAAAGWLKAKTAILDGEVIIMDDKSRSDFGALRRSMRTRESELVFVTFDLLHLNGKDMRPMGCVERRESLWNLVAPAEGVIQYSQHVDFSGKAFFAAVDGLGLEGMVSKRAGAAYVGGQSTTWLKTKCYQETDYEIAGIQRERGKPAMALMVDAERNYVGAAFITANRAMRERLWARVKKSAGPPPKGVKPWTQAEWIKPGIVGRVKHLKGEEMLRHASLKTIID